MTVREDCVTGDSISRDNKVTKSPMSDDYMHI